MAKEKRQAQALPEGEEDAQPKKRNKRKLIIILVALLLMLGGIGGGAYWWFFLRAPGSFPSSLWKGGDGEKTEEVSEQGEAANGKEDAKGERSKEHVEAKGEKGGTIERPAGLPRNRGIVVPLPMITVNLFDAGGRRYLKLGMEVEANRDISKELKDNEARVRDAVIMLLAGKSYAELASPDGKVMLKAEVANRLNQILGEQRVIRIFFTDFVIQ